MLFVTIASARATIANARNDMTISGVGQDERILQRLPARDHCIFERCIHVGEPVIDLCLIEIRVDLGDRLTCLLHNPL